MEKTTQIQIVTFYRFVPLPDYRELQQPLREFCDAQQIKGTILLAEEGLNSTLSGKPEAIAAFFKHLDADPRLAGMEYKSSYALDYPFKRLKVMLKKEIVRMGVPTVDGRKAGSYADAATWEALLDDPEVVVIDTRNSYEVEVGTFKGAIDPKTDNFQEFPAWVKANLDPAKHKKVAMFCTGGIRCEKSTAYLLNEGFDEVYHLKGGILQYLEDTQNSRGYWQGECFVFDDRRAVDEELHPANG